MNIISYLFQPLIFFSLLVVILILSVFTIRSFSRQYKKLSEEKEEGRKKDKVHIAELEAMVAAKENELKANAMQLESALRNKEEEFKKRLTEREAQLKKETSLICQECREELKSGISKLEVELREKEEALKNEISLKDALNKKIGSLQEEITKVKSELSLKNQMYEGLRGQYDELEKDLAKIAKQLLEEGEKKHKEAHPTQNIQEKTKPKEHPSPQIEIKS